MMVRAEAQTGNTLEKARLLYEAGRIYREKLESELNAADLFARVLELDPEHVEAGEPLAEIHFRDQQWANLQPILHILTEQPHRKDNNKDHKPLHRVLSP